MGRIISIPAPLTVQYFEEKTTVSDGDVLAYSEEEFKTAACDFVSYTEKCLSLGLKAKKSDEDARIVLVKARDLSGEEYKLSIKDKITVEAGSSLGMNRAFSTLLQYFYSCKTDGVGTVTLGNISVYDKPAKEYRGVMIDPARSFIGIDIIKRIIRECWLCKMNYLHIHFTDTGSFTFPWSYSVQKSDGRETYQKDDLIGLNAYAERLGVTIIPEIDVPGHQGLLLEWFPDIFIGDRKEKESEVMCIGREEVYEKLESLVDEMIEIFPNTPYIHLGFDESKYDGWEICRDCIAFRAAHGITAADGIPSAEEQLKYAINRMSEYVKSKGKRLAVWESFHDGGNIKVDRDVVIYEFETAYNLPDRLLCEGYTLVNCSNSPLYCVPYWPAHFPGRTDPDTIYNEWDVNTFIPIGSGSPVYPDGVKVEPTEKIVGAQICCWETPACDVYGAVSDKIPIVAEKVWRSEIQCDYEAFTARWNGIRTLTEKLVD